MRFPALFLLLCLFTSSYGQDRPTGYVTLGNIPLKFTNGKTDASVVTRAEILANAALTSPVPSIEIIGFTFSMLPKGRDFVGPYTVKGAQFTSEIISKINELTDPQAKIFIENITAKVDGTTRHISPILLNMVLNK